MALAIMLKSRLARFAPGILPGVALAIALADAASSFASAQSLDKVSFGTNWVAEGEHGGFLPGAGRRHLSQIWPRRHHRAGRAQR